MENICGFSGIYLILHDQWLYSKVNVETILFHTFHAVQTTMGFLDNLSLNSECSVRLQSNLCADVYILFTNCFLIEDAFLTDENMPE